jgi:hypothetical protein
MHVEAGKKKILNLFPPFSLSLFPLQLAQTLTKPIPISSCRHDKENQETHASATMPCIWTGYGEPLPRLPINIGENLMKGVGDFF